MGKRKATGKTTSAGQPINGASSALSSSSRQRSRPRWAGRQSTGRGNAARPVTHRKPSGLRPSRPLQRASGSLAALSSESLMLLRSGPTRDCHRPRRRRAQPRQRAIAASAHPRTDAVAEVTIALPPGHGFTNVARHLVALSPTEHEWCTSPTTASISGWLMDARPRRSQASLARAHEIPSTHLTAAGSVSGRIASSRRSRLRGALRWFCAPPRIHKV